MRDILSEMRRAYAACGVKKVTKTDVDKRAYLPNKGQREVLRKAGIIPILQSAERTFPIRVAGTGQILETSYYNSQRVGAGRAPEARMGRGLLDWLSVGDDLLLVTDGREVFAFKMPTSEQLAADPGIAPDTIGWMYSQLSDAKLLARANEGSRKPVMMKIETTAYDRDPAVREFVIRRCRRQCESPGCRYVGFETDGGETYIEVHHIKPLGDIGDDSIDNTAGLCPTCHRRAHHGRDRAAIAASLRSVVTSANNELIARIRGSA